MEIIACDLCKSKNTFTRTFSLFGTPTEICDKCIAVGRHNVLEQCIRCSTLSWVASDKDDVDLTIKKCLCANCIQMFNNEE